MIGGDLEDHFRSGHGVSKRDLARWVELTIGGGRKEQQEIVNLAGDKDTFNDVENKNEGNFERYSLINHKDKTTKQNMTQPSISGKRSHYENFIDMKKKAIVDSMIMTQIESLKTDSNKPLPSYEDIKGNFEKMRKSLLNIDISASDEKSLRQEFESFTSGSSIGSLRRRGGLSQALPRGLLNTSSGALPQKPAAPSSATEAHFKVPISTARPLLSPVASDRSDMSARGLSTYSCPLAPSCSFLISKTQLKEFHLAWQHLDKTHNITTQQLKAAEGTGKFKFNKIKV